VVLAALAGHDEASGVAVGRPLHASHAVLGEHRARPARLRLQQVHEQPGVHARRKPRYVLQMGVALQQRALLAHHQHVQVGARQVDRRRQPGDPAADDQCVVSRPFARIASRRLTHVVGESATG